MSRHTDRDQSIGKVACDERETMRQTLWCVHMIGPDSVLPTSSFDEAEMRATKINADLRRLGKAQGWEVPMVRAVVATWPNSAESHDPGSVDWDGDLC